MAELVKIRAQNYGPIKDISFDLRHKGVSVIFGKNKDAGVANYTNAAAKSLVFSVIPEMIWGAPPSGKDTTKQKGILSQTWKDAKGDLWRFEKHLGKSKKFEIYKNKKSVDNRTLSWAEQKLRSFLGCSEIEFYATRYIDGTIPHPLIAGTAAQREDYFVRLFNLQDVDHMRTMLNAELREAQKAKSTFTELKDVYDEQKAKIGQDDFDDNCRRLKKLQNRQSDLVARVTQMQETSRLIGFEETQSKLISRFRQLTSVDTFSDDLEQLNRKIKSTRKAIEVAEEWTEYRRDYKKWKATKEEVEQKLGKLGVEFDEDKIKSQYKVYASATSELDDLSRDLSRLEKQLDSARSDLKELGDVSAPEYALDKCEDKVVTLRQELKHVQKFHSGKCPTCGSKVEAREEADIERDLQKWKSRKDEHEEYEAAKEHRTAIKKLKSEVATAQAKKDKAAKVVQETRPYYEAREVIRDLSEKPEKPESEAQDEQHLREELEKLQQRKSYFAQFDDVIETLRDLEKVTPEERKAVKAMSELSDTLSSLNTKITLLSARVTEQREAIRTIGSLRDRMIEFRDKAREEKVLKILVAAYSKKGLKKVLIQSYASRLQEQVNKIARLFLTEDIRFEFSYDKRMEVLAHRVVSKKDVRTSDVKRLSGAEKRMFTLMLVAASISLLPKSRRPSTVVFDEPEANMGPEAVKNFIRILPVLNKIIPHIVIITPRPELHVPNARTFTVVKHRGVSKMVEGTEC